MGLCMNCINVWIRWIHLHCDCICDPGAPWGRDLPSEHHGGILFDAHWFRSMEVFWLTHIELDQWRYFDWWSILIRYSHSCVGGCSPAWRRHDGPHHSVRVICALLITQMMELSMLFYERFSSYASRHGCNLQQEDFLRWRRNLYFSIDVMWGGNVVPISMWIGETPLWFGHTGMAYWHS